MKNILFIAALVMLLGCGGASTEDQKDPNANENKVAPSDTLDALLSIASEKELKEIYGEKNVSWDTIYDVEGEMSMGTVLYSGTPDNVIIDWEDAQKREKVISVIHSCQYNMQTDKHDLKTRWFTKAGVRIGTPLTKLVELNGKDFMFYGLGWDNGGTVFNWKDGNLGKANVFVTLGMDEVAADKQKDYETIMGDTEFSSANPAARSVNPVVFEIIVSKE
jgi:hypothetical protein